jgi:hypothetical protein
LSCLRDCDFMIALPCDCLACTVLGVNWFVFLLFSYCLRGALCCLVASFFLVLSCLVLSPSCLVLSCPVLSCLVLSYPIVFFLFSCLSPSLSPLLCICLIIWLILTWVGLYWILSFFLVGIVLPLSPLFLVVYLISRSYLRSCLRSTWFVFICHYHRLCHALPCPVFVFALSSWLDLDCLDVAWYVLNSLALAYHVFILLACLAVSWSLVLPCPVWAWLVQRHKGSVITSIAPNNARITRPFAWVGPPGPSLPHCVVLSCVVSSCGAFMWCLPFCCQV